MGDLGRYLKELRRIHESGESTQETSFYPALSGLLNAIGSALNPAVHCVITPKNRGAGIPDGGLFLKRSLDPEDEDPLSVRMPERGALEVKAIRASLERVAASAQVDRYLKRYGQVLITNYRQFQMLRLESDGKTVRSEILTLAPNETALWSLDLDALNDLEDEVEQFLRRVLLADAPLSSPQDLAGFLAAYARIARARIEKTGMTHELKTLKVALEDALGLRFEGQSGDDFFRSALVQTLFYGVFASWVNWSNTSPSERVPQFSWRTVGWTFKVPMVRVLFDQLATPRNLPAGLDEILDWTEEVFARIDKDQFFERFEQREAVQYFYEPFLQAYDPNLRRELGVWYTPPEVVRYMVARVHESLQRDLGIELGLADERVHVLDPCTGTGSFLIEALRTATEVLEEVHEDALVPQQIKEAALHRFHGFEILPAPFIITHLQLGLFLSELGAPLEGTNDERPSVYLSNALTGWEDDPEQILPFEEFRSERQAAGDVKRAKPILVVIGNPPYNGFTGVGDELEGDLVAPYKEGLSAAPWEITKNKLDDYYVRFFRVAERRIAEITDRGIISFVSNFGWLGDPSAVLMRRHLLSAFDRIYIDNLNGDSRETGKKTPEGKPDPSIFSSKLSPSGIQVGAAISLLVRTKEGRKDRKATVMYRDLWGSEKARELERSLGDSQDDLPYEGLRPTEANWFRLRRWRPRPGYEMWPSLVDLSRTDPELGLNENRGEGLIDTDREALGDRIGHFLDEKLDFSKLDPDRAGALLEPWSGYKAKDARQQIQEGGGYGEEAVRPFLVRPFDLRWAYVDPRAKLWNRPRPKFQAAAVVGSDFLLCRRSSPRALDGAAFFLSSTLADQHALHKDAYAIPLLLARETEEESEGRLFALKDVPAIGPSWIPNLSSFATSYLAELGYDDVEASRESARTLWLHALAVGYSPLYLEENADALRAGWPRIPLPHTRKQLEESAGLGVRLGGLLDIGTPLPGLDTSTVAHLRRLGGLERTDSKNPRSADLVVSAGWANLQTRKQKSGAVSKIVMPAAGRVVRRRRTQDEDWKMLDPLHQNLLGEDLLDVYLNDETYWKGIPEAAWNFKIGGFQVLRKWLSYREETVLGRALSRREAREFQSIARRLTEIVLLGPALDANYRTATGSFDQEALIEIPVEQQD